MDVGVLLMTGWECPRCGIIHAPFVARCDCVVSTETVTAMTNLKLGRTARSPSFTDTSETHCAEARVVEEREACAKLAERSVDFVPVEIAGIIRARGKE